MKFEQWEILWQLEQLERYDSGTSFVPVEEVTTSDENVEDFCEEYFARG